MADTIEIPWMSIVLQADPDHTREAANPVEYEFSAPGGGNPLTHDGNKRIFSGYYAKRGPYAT